MNLSLLLLMTGLATTAGGCAHRGQAEGPVAAAGASPVVLPVVLPVVTIGYDRNDSTMIVDVENRSPGYLEITDISVNEYPSPGLPEYDSGTYRTRRHWFLLDTVATTMAWTVIANGRTVDLEDELTPGGLWLAPGISCRFVEKLTDAAFFKKSRFTVGRAIVRGRSGSLSQPKWSKCVVRSEVIVLSENLLIDGRGVE